MNIRSLITGLLAFVLLAVTTAGSINAQDRERGNQQERAQELRHHANQLEEQLHKYMEQRKEINAALENINAKERPDKHDQLMNQRKELDAAMATIRQEFAAMRERNQERGQERDRPRERERAPQRENPKLQHAGNQLEHMLKAHAHLREAGMTEIAQMVGERAEKLQRLLRESDQRRQESDRDEIREERRTDQPRRERARRERTDADEAFRKEISGAIQELSAAIRSLRNDMEKLSGTKKAVALEVMRKRIGESVWKMGDLRILLHKNGSTGLYMSGGRWEMVSPRSIKVYDKTDKYRVTIAFTRDFRSGKASWVDGGPKQTVQRLK